MSSKEQAPSTRAEKKTHTGNPALQEQPTSSSSAPRKAEDMPANASDGHGKRGDSTPRTTNKTLGQLGQAEPKKAAEMARSGVDEENQNIPARGRKNKGKALEKSRNRSDPKEDERKIEVNKPKKSKEEKKRIKEEKKKKKRRRNKEQRKKDGSNKMTRSKRGHPGDGRKNERPHKRRKVRGLLGKYLAKQILMTS